MQRVLTLVDLFSGCGGMTRGFVDSGAFRSVFAVEFDRDAATTYAANFGDHVACGPIEDVASFPAADVVIDVQRAGGVVDPSANYVVSNGNS